MMLLVFPQVASAGVPRDVDAGSATAKSGVPTTVRYFWNCTRAMPGLSGAAEHGSMTVKSSTGNHCGRPDQPVLELVYTSQPGFKGDDRATYYWTRYPYSLRIRVQ